MRTPAPLATFAKLASLILAGTLICLVNGSSSNEHSIGACHGPVCPRGHIGGRRSSLRDAHNSRDEEDFDDGGDSRFSFPSGLLTGILDVGKQVIPQIGVNALSHAINNGIDHALPRPVSPNLRAADNIDQPNEQPKLPKTLKEKYGDVDISPEINVKLGSRSSRLNADDLMEHDDWSPTDRHLYNQNDIDDDDDDDSGPYDVHIDDLRDGDSRSIPGNIFSNLVRFLPFVGPALGDSVRDGIDSLIDGPPPTTKMPIITTTVKPITTTSSTKKSTAGLKIRPKINLDIASRSSFDPDFGNDSQDDSGDDDDDDFDDKYDNEDKYQARSSRNQGNRISLSPITGKYDANKHGDINRPVNLWG